MGYNFYKQPFAVIFITLYWGGVRRFSIYQGYNILAKYPQQKNKKITLSGVKQSASSTFA